MRFILLLSLYLHACPHFHEVKDISENVENLLVSLDSNFFSSREVILAFYPYTFHTVLIIKDPSLLKGGFEYHGRLITNKAIIRNIRDHRSFRSGLFIRFNDLKTKQLKQLVKYIKNVLANARTSSCIHGACEALSRGAKIHIPLEKTHNLREFLDLFFENKVKDNNDQLVSYDIFKVRKESVSKILESTYWPELKLGIIGRVVNSALYRFYIPDENKKGVRRHHKKIQRKFFFSQDSYPMR